MIRRSLSYEQRGSVHQDQGVVRVQRLSGGGLI